MFFNIWVIKNVDPIPKAVGTFAHGLGVLEDAGIICKYASGFDPFFYAGVFLQTPTRETGL